MKKKQYLLLFVAFMSYMHANAQAPEDSTQFYRLIYHEDFYNAWDMSLVRLKSGSRKSTKQRTKDTLKYLVSS